MEEHCKNCGTKLKKDSKFCQECGSPLENEEEIKTLETEDTNNIEYHDFCPNCGSDLSDDDEFCTECGTDLKNPVMATDEEPQEKSFFEKNKIPIIIVSIVAIVVLALLLMTAIPQESETYDYDYGTQTVDVGGVDFSIPGDYRLVPSSIDYDYENYVMSYTHTYTNGDENITIGILDSGYNVDAQDVNDQTGGIKKTMFGYEGYYNELSDGYVFSFAKGNKLCLVFASSPYVFDQIDVIG